MGCWNCLPPAGEPGLEAGKWVLFTVGPPGLALTLVLPPAVNTWVAAGVCLPAGSGSAH